MEAYLDWQKKGGIKLNDVIEEYRYVAAGKQIKAGDLVNYINGVAGKKDYGESVDTQLSTETYTGYSISALQLDENRVFIAHNYSSSYYLYGVVCTIEGGTITYGADTQLSNETYSGYTISAVTLDENRVFVVHRTASNNYISGLVCTISGTTITKGTDTTLVSNGYSAYAISAVKLDENRVFVAHCYDSSYYLYGIVCTINGATITKGTDTSLVTSSYAGYAMSACLLPNGNVFIAHSYGNTNYGLYGIVCTISGTTITKGTDTQLVNGSYAGYKVSTVALDDNRVFIAHCYDSSKFYLYGMIVSISGTTITKGTDTALNNTTNMTSAYIISTCLLPNGNVFIAHCYSSTNYLYGMVVTISGTTINVGTDTALVSSSYAGYYMSSALMPNGTIFIAHCHTGSKYYLYAQIFGIDEANNVPTNNIVITEYEQQVTPAIEPPFNAIALSSGVGGTEAEHNEQVKIARLVTIKEDNLIDNGNFENGLDGWEITNFATATVTDGKLSISIPSSGKGGQGVIRNLPNIFVENHIYYFSAEAKSTKYESGVTDAENIYAIIENGKTMSATGDLTIDNEWHKLSLLHTAEAGTSSDKLSLIMYQARAGGISGWDNVMLIDLTKLFGTGNEPTKEWCDANLGGEA